MRFSTLAATVAAAAPALVAAQSQNIQIMVGANDMDMYTPANVTANIGDTVTFVFVGGNHTVTQSTFAAPCTSAFNTTSMMAGFDTGFKNIDPTSDAQVPAITIQVNSMDPFWFFCAQDGHCQEGMVGSINAVEGSSNSYEVFQAAAMKTTTTNYGTPMNMSMSMGMSMSMSSTATATGTAASMSATAKGNGASAARTAKGAGALLAGVGLAAALLL